MHIDMRLHADNLADPDAGNDPIITFKGHTLTIDEAHSLVLGTVGVLYGLSKSATQSLDREPHYFFGAFLTAYLIGRELRQRDVGVEVP